MLKAVKQMYYTFVFPYLIYCCEIWGNTSHTCLDPIIKYQKKIIRIMTVVAMRSSQCVNRGRAVLSLTIH